MAVLVAGAGPVGLALAAGLAGQGVPCRVVDAAPGPGAGTRCPNLWPRTQQALHRLGVDMDELLGRAAPFTHKVWQPFDRPIRVDIRDDAGPWATPVTVPQETVTGLLLRRLAALGVTVQWSTRVGGVEPGPDGVTAVLTAPGRPAEVVRASWLVGADGADSAVRAALGVGWDVTEFDDVTWTQLDVAVTAPAPLEPHAEYVFHGDRVHLGLVPLPGGAHRLFLAEPRSAGRPATDGGAALTALLRRVSGQDHTVTALGRPWSVRPRAALASAFRRGRCLLAGEAARVFPLPVQAMNTGVQDAENLAWKLAAVLTGRAGEDLIDTYERERRPVAEALINRTGWLLTSSLEPESVELLREGYARRGGRPLIRTEPDVRYEDGPLVGATAPGGPVAGQPLPDAPVTLPDGCAGSLVRLLNRHAWALLVPAGANGAVPDRTAGLRTYRLAPPGSPPAAGLIGDPAGAVHRMLGDRLCLVRPDGFVGSTVPLDDPGSLDGYLGRVLER